MDVFTKGYIDPQLKREELITRLKVRGPCAVFLCSFGFVNSYFGVLLNRVLFPLNCVGHLLTSTRISFPGDFRAYESVYMFCVTALAFLRMCVRVQIKLNLLFEKFTITCCGVRSPCMAMAAETDCGLV
jgi:hypothetical protein